MKLLNHTTYYFAAALLVVLSVWAIIFYYALLGIVYDNIDDSLEDSKTLIIQKSIIDSTVLSNSNFREGNYSLREIPAEKAISFEDVFIDTIVYLEIEQEEEPVRMLKTAFRHDDRYFQLRVITSTVETDDLIEDLLYYLLWLYIGLIVSIILINNFLLKKIWKPFYLLLKRLKQFQLNDPTPIVLEKTRVEEFRALNETITKLLQSNIDTYVSQKQFIENASHEIQTPLAIALNKLELLIENNNYSEEQLQKLASIVDNLERLTRLNKSLLLLSKIENKQFGQVKELSISKLTNHIIEDFSEQATYKNIDIAFNKAGKCRQVMHHDLANIMITNLLKNAIAHNTSGGFVHIMVTNTSFIIENSGSEKALDERTIYSRFTKGDKPAQSTGLGLSIVKAIIDYYQFSIQYEYRNNHYFKIEF